MSANADLDILAKEDSKDEWSRVLVEFKHFPQHNIDPTHKVRLLPSARTRLVSVPPAASISEAFTLMMNYNYSQLPVVDGEHHARKVFSWRSYGKKVAQGVECRTVAEAMEPAAIIDLNDSVFEAFAAAARNDYVLVRDKDQKICGIVTTYDISELFARLAEPFLLLEEIEKRIRTILEGHVTSEELKEVSENHQKDTPKLSDLVFGGYIKLFRKEDVWRRLNFRLHQKTFIKLADEVREVRNEVMHFRPIAISEERRDSLRNFAKFLREISPSVDRRS